MKGQYLKVRKGGLRVKHIPDRPINTGLQTFLHEITSNGLISSKTYNNLSDSDKLLVDSLTTKHKSNEIDSVIDRFNILKGEILIGNDNIDILRELRSVILRLVGYKILNMRDIAPLLEKIIILL